MVGAGLLATLLVACGPAQENTLADARAALEAQHPAKAIAVLKPYISENFEDGVARALLAEALLDSGNLEEGRREIAEAERLRAPRSALRVSECRVAAQIMTLDEAMARCAAAQGETTTERAALHLHGGLTQLAAQNPVAAIAEIKAALLARPAWLLALRALAVAQTQAGDDAAAARTLLEVFKLAPNAPESFHLQGELAFLRGQYAVAAAAFAKAGDAATENPGIKAKAREHQVQAHLLAQQPKLALEVASGLVTTAGVKPLDKFLYGQALAADGQFVEARNALEDLLLQLPNLAQAKIIVGISLLGLGQAGQAEMYLRNALIDLPENALALASLAALEQHRVAPEQAFQRVQSKFNGSEQDPQWLAWGSLLQLRQPPEEAADAAHLLHQKVMVLLHAGNRPGALALVKAELAKREAPETLAEYAGLIAPTDFPGAQKAMARALELDRDNVKVLNAYGELFLAAGKPLEALPHLERATKIEPRNPSVQYHLALAYFATSNRSAARDAISEALRGGHMFDDRRAAETLAEEVGAR
jgi:tetratricopeptide (TPR) repeat protein